MAKTPLTPKPEGAIDPGERITIPLDKDGIPELGRMRESSRERLKTWLKHPGLSDALGVRSPMPASSAASVKAADVLPDSVVDSLIGTLGQVAAALIERAYDCTPEQAALMLFTERETADLRDPLKGVINKYGDTMLTKYGDEIALVAMLATLETRKVSAVKSAILAARRPATVASIVRQPETSDSSQSQDGML